MIDVIVCKPSPYGLVFIHDKLIGFIIYHIKHERVYVSYMLSGAQGFKGAGGVDDLGKVKIEFSIVSYRSVCQLPGAFYRIKTYCS